MNKKCNSLYDLSKHPLLASQQRAKTGFLKRGPRPPLGATEQFSEVYEQRPSLGSFAEAFTSIAKPKCHNIKYLPVTLKFVVFIITS